MKSNVINNDQVQKYKSCAGKGCKNEGKHYGKILYINEYRWFCDSCKVELVNAGLIALSDLTELENTNKSNKENTCNRKQKENVSTNIYNEKNKACTICGKIHIDIDEQPNSKSICKWILESSLQNNMKSGGVD